MLKKINYFLLYSFVPIFNTYFLTSTKYYKKACSPSIALTSIRFWQVVPIFLMCSTNTCITTFLYFLIIYACWTRLYVYDVMIYLCLILIFYYVFRTNVILSEYFVLHFVYIWIYENRVMYTSDACSKQFTNIKQIQYFEMYIRMNIKQNLRTHEMKCITEYARLKIVEK